VGRPRAARADESPRLRGGPAPWQPISLELSATRVVALLPKGTCGNTFHRLVTNVQRHVCPKIDVWLGACLSTGSSAARSAGGHARLTF
jgi:hypothetical protein